MNLVTPIIPEIGAPCMGGFFAGQIRVGTHTYGLIVAPLIEGETLKAWGPSAAIPGAASFFDGFANTNAMADAGSDLARWARGLTIAGLDDWYLPARDELELLYRHFKPTTEVNYCWRGDNPSSVPVGYAYTPTAPAQSTVVAFAEDGPDAFSPEGYWSSTQYAGYSDCAWFQGFDVGGQYGYGKSFEGRARAVRRFLID
jgi:hypothetical protein